GAAKCINNDTELARAWEEALEPEEIKKAAENCDKYFQTLGGAAKKTWDEIEKCINTLITSLPIN
ncbi:MAG: hypothetical protein IJP96_12775, partial [Synergistaceae bacterium]|nr:hypothetical protein [Synergistaceae bacterium]